VIARVAIIGCGASKAAAPCEARDLYTGPLFRAARAHVERLGCPWWVLSARYGLVEPWRTVPPYEATIAEGRRDVETWSRLTGICAGTLGGLAHGTYGRALGWPAEVVLEVHAGAAYVAWLAEIVSRSPAAKQLRLEINDPCRGLEIGERLHWYAERRTMPIVAARVGEWGRPGADPAPPRQRQLGLFGAA